MDVVTEQDDRAAPWGERGVRPTLGGRSGFGAVWKAPGVTLALIGESHLQILLKPEP